MEYRYSKAIKYYLKNLLSKIKREQKGKIIVAFLFMAIFASSFFLERPHPLKSSQGYTQEQSQLDKGYQCPCKINHISDGDSITAICPASCSPTGKASGKWHKLRVRIWGMDAPEMGQKPWGDRAKKALINLLPKEKNGIITLKIRDRDHYQRYVAQLFDNQKDIGLEMVRLGEAVVYRQYNNDPQYYRAEEEAKAAKRGIWSQAGHQQDPAAWRKVNPR